MKLFYKKHNVIKLFGIKVVENTTDYLERSTDKDEAGDEFYTDLNEQIILNKGKK